MPHMFRKGQPRGAAALLGVLLWLAAWPLWAQEAYRIGAGDQISVRVVAWDSIELQFVEFDALGGAYTVSQDGTVTLPLLGAVQAADRNTAELAVTVTNELQERLGLVEPPSTSIEVVAFRPIYVLGDVARPGSYEYNPGLTALQALALAGGVYRLLDTGPNRASEAIRAGGTLRELRVDLARERMRAARLKAEMEGATAFSPPSLPPHPDGEVAQASLYDNERKLFESRRDSLARALASLEQSKALLETEISALAEKTEGLRVQVEIVREAVGNMEALLERGLARSPNLTNMQRTLIDLEARELDTETEVFRARQQLSELDRDRIDLETQRSIEVLRELQRSEAEIDRMMTRAETTNQLLVGAETMLSEEDDLPQFRPRFFVTRAGGGGELTDIEPNTPLKPLDVLEVELVPAEPTEGG